MDILFLIPKLLPILVVVLLYIVCICVSYIMFQSLEDTYKWIRREWRLLAALKKDEENLSESGKKIDEKALQLWDSQLRPGVTVRLQDAERAWVDATKNVVREANRCVETYRGLSLRRKFPIWVYSSVRDIPKIRGLRADMSRIKLDIIAHMAKKEIEAKDIYGSLEKSRSNVRSLQDRPIEEQQSSIYEPGKPISSIEEKIDGMMYENPDLMLVMQKQIESINLLVKPLVAFLKDLNGLRFESEIEKAWVNEAEEIIVEVQRDIDSIRRRAHLSLWPSNSESADRLKSINLLYELFERKIVYGFTFIRRSNILHRSPLQHSFPSQIADDMGILSLVEKIRNDIIGEPTIATANKLKNLSDHFKKVYELFRDEKTIEGRNHSRTAWMEQMRIIVRDAERSLRTYTPSSASERSNSQNERDFCAEIDQLAHALSLLEKSIKVFGLEYDIHEVVSRLTSTTIVENRSSVVSIVGMKGIGKTTLAKIIYKDTAIKEHFKVFLWILGDQVPGNDMERNEKEFLIKKVRDFLKVDKYLVVLDNISTNKAWDDLKEAIPEATNGSRILVTTRYKSVALHVDQSSVPLQLLLRTKNHSWNLFTQTVRFQPEVSPKVKTLANKVVGRCGGLPLSIFRLGYLLSGKEVTAEELSRVLEHINIHNQTPWSETLDINVEDLPLHLKQCLSYLGHFPRDSEIPKGRLLALWVAEGFAQQSGDEQERQQICDEQETVESIAEKYLSELISRNLVQLVARKINGEVKTCAFPSALRELWLRRYPSSSFDQRLAYYSDESDASSSQSHGSSTNSPNILRSYRNPQSILFFDTREGNKPGEDIGNFLRRGIASGHLLQLQALDLEHVFRPQLPDTIGKLVRLKYLGLRWTYLETIPSSIGKLRNLENLDMEHTYIRTLPKSIWKLQKLRHLYINEIYRTKIEHHPRGNSLQNLETLQGAFVDKDSPLKDCLYRLINLRKLKVVIQLSLSQQEALAEGLVKLTHLKTLKLKSIDELGHAQDLKVMRLSGLKKLSSLYLFGKLEKPSNITTINVLPQNLVDLTLSASRLSDDPMPELKKLHRLKSLSFYSDSYTGKIMDCSIGGFPQLLTLKFWMLPELEAWNVEEQALPSLKRLEIRSCRRLRVLSGLGHLKSLRELKLKNIPMETKEKIWKDIAHSPAIIIDMK
ncbi:putative disease resistance protein At1g50180 [Fagus crenata]